MLQGLARRTSLDSQSASVLDSAADEVMSSRRAIRPHFCSAADPFNRSTVNAGTTSAAFGMLD